MWLDFSKANKTHGGNWCNVLQSMQLLLLQLRLPWYLVHCENDVWKRSDGYAASKPSWIVHSLVSGHLANCPACRVHSLLKSFILNSNTNTSPSTTVDICLSLCVWVWLVEFKSDKDKWTNKRKNEKNKNSTPFQSLGAVCSFVFILCG